MNIFSILSGITYGYSILCFIRIILSWFPGILQSPFGKIISVLTDSYLNLFKKLTFLRIGVLDLSAALAVSLLMALTYILTGLAFPDQITTGVILAQIFAAIWQLASTFFILFIVVLVIRAIVQLFARPFKPESPFWEAFDRKILPFVYAISNFFTGRRNVQYKTALLITDFALFAVYWVLNSFVVPFVYNLLYGI